MSRKPRHPLPTSFNEAYVEELRALRPNEFANFTPAKYVSIAEDADTRSHKARQSAANLAELFEQVHTTLDEKHAAEGKTPLAALCLSGGGIRSATFNLGLIQGLARIGILRRFDYLSSVSGGGYIAGWLKAWMQREGGSHVITELARAAETPAGEAEANKPSSRNPLAPEPGALDRLREYSNYLTPKVGLFSPDTWTAAALVIRNLILNWLVFVPLLAAAIAIPQVAVLAVQASPSSSWERGVVYTALGMAVIASFFVHWLRHPSFAGGRRDQRMIVLGVVVPVYLAAAFLALGVAWAPWEWWSAESLQSSLGGLLSQSWLPSGIRLQPGQSLGPQASRLLELTAFASIWTLLIPVTGWVVTEVVRSIRRRVRNEKAQPGRGRGLWWELFALVVSGVVAGAILVWIGYNTICGSVCGKSAYFLDRPILFVILALPALLANYLLARTLFVAFASLGEERSTKHTTAAGHSAASLDDFDREWWARLSGWVLAAAVGWAAFSTVSLIGGYLLHWSLRSYAPELVAGMGGIAGVITAILARSSETSSGRGTTTTSASKRKDISLKVAAPVFILILGAFLALGTAALGRAFTGEQDLLRYPPIDDASAPPTGAPATPAAPKRKMSILQALTVKEKTLPVRPKTFWVFVGMGLGLAGMAFIFARVVNVNRYSMHGLYRNRLVRAYLGASNAKRNPDPFTGFATTDNLALSDLWCPDGTDHRLPVRLLPVVNTTLNLVMGGKRLAWQMRKAESFSMTPFYCGNFHEGYRPSTEYGGRGGISLGTAMTISGAAANPNMGYHSSATLTFIMSLLNARLGAWLGNTNEHGRKVYDRYGPKYALKPLIAELLGQTNSDHAYINLSDGGHFDNLGLYEMVLRRCRYILVGDAGRDPSAGFEDLGNAIRKIRIDFGIPIEFHHRIRIFPAEEQTASLFCATAEIHYKEIDGAKAQNGQLVYLKPALFGHGRPVPYDVFAYSRTSADFPHESTSDQWFDEAQFESYRALGLHAITQVAGSAGKTTSFPEFLNAIGQYVTATAKEQQTAGPPHQPGS